MQDNMRLFRVMMIGLFLIQIFYSGCEFKPDEIDITQINPPDQQGPPILVSLNEKNDTIKIGWPTNYDKNDVGIGAQGTQFQRHPDEEQQDIFFKAITKWSEKNRIMTYWFEIFDESWKGGGSNSSPDHAEKHWGLFNEDRSPKKAMRNSNEFLSNK